MPTNHPPNTNQTPIANANHAAIANPHQDPGADTNQPRTANTNDDQTAPTDPAQIASPNQARGANTNQARGASTDQARGASSDQVLIGHTDRARVAIAYHSGRGHTARQAEAVAAGASGVPGVVADLVPLDELTEELWDRLNAADAIIFGAPTYMGSPSAVFKTFAEASVRVWAADLGWRDKIAAGFTNSKAMAGDKLNSLVDFAVLAAQHGMI